MKARKLIAMLTLTAAASYFAPSIAFATDSEDLISLRNSWNQYMAELPNRSPELQCSGLGVLRVLANSFMSRHSTSSYAQKYNSMLTMYRCNGLAPLEIYANLSAEKPAADTETRPGCSLSSSEIYNISRGHRVVVKGTNCHAIFH